MFDAIKPADVKTVGNLAVAGGIALGVYEVFGSNKPAYLWPGLLVVGGIAAHVAVMDGKSIAALGQASAASSGADAGKMTTCQIRNIPDQAQRDKEVKALPYVIGGAAALLILKILL